MKSFEKSKWIWLACGEGDDQYAEFFDTVEYNGGELLLRISCDSDYAVFLNGEYLASGQYGDYPHYKIYDELDLSPYLIAGDNRLEFLVYHLGSAGFSRYFPAEAGLLYEVVRGDVLRDACKLGVFVQKPCRLPSVQSFAAFSYEEGSFAILRRNQRTGFHPACEGGG